MQLPGGISPTEGVNDLLALSVRQTALMLRL